MNNAKTLIFALAALFVLGACSSSETTAPSLDAEAAILTVVFPSHPADTLDVLVTDSATIVAAEAFIRTGAGASLVSGRIVKGSGWDVDYPFHFVAESVRLVDLAIEICDGAPMRTPQAVDEFFGWATGNANAQSAPWCPWGSRPIAIQRISAAGL
jgi:hypothetical protein